MKVSKLDENKVFETVERNFTKMFETIWGSSKADDGRPFKKHYSYELEEMSRRLTDHLTDLDENGYKITIEQLEGVIVYIWSTLGLYETDNKSGFKKMSEKIVKRIYGK